MKKILFLGASHAQLPPIKYAVAQGYIVYTVDNRPNNPGHALAHRSFEISTVDREQILKLATDLEIDAIIAYASDPAAPTAAYVSEKLRLVGNPLKSVETLTNKGKFRKYLNSTGFLSPTSSEFSELAAALEYAKQLSLPIFIKPIDSSGSKGVTKINSLDELPNAFTRAKQYSISQAVVVEEMIPRSYRQVDSDIFMQNGEILFWIWGDQRQDPICHEYAPIGISFPSQLTPSIQNHAINIVENVLKGLNFHTGAFNIEFLVDEFDNVWIIEIGPRNGGNLIPEVIHLCTGQNMVEWTVEAALGKEIAVSQNRFPQRFVSSYLIHARDNGIFFDLFIDERVKFKIRKIDIFVETGSVVKKYEGSNTTLGMIIFEFASATEMAEIMDNIEDFVKVTLVQEYD